MTDVHYTPNWEDETAQCKNCKSFQHQNNQNACVPPDKTFEEAIEAYGEVSPAGHCDYFQSK